jgi:hypothetical protein
VSASLHPDGQAFADALLERFPEWKSYLREYCPRSSTDRTIPGSLELEVSAPSDPALKLWLIVEEGDALLGLGERAAEANFVWDKSNRREAIADVMQFIEDIRSAEVIMVWDRHRFLWKTWESARFCRAADVYDGSRAPRIIHWLGPTISDHSAAT